MENYGIIGWIVIGGIAGAIAKLLMPGRDPGGCIITVLLGIAGALVAGWLGHAVGWYGTERRRRLHRRDRRRFHPAADLPADRRRRRPDVRPVQQSAMARGRALAHGNECPGERDMKTILLAALMLGAAALAAAASAQQASITQTIAGTRLDISATGEVTRVPDLAIISAGVVTRSPTATARFSRRRRGWQRVRAALKRGRDRRPRHPDQQHQPQSRISLC